MITKTIELIKEQTGIGVKLCEDFTGLLKHGDRKYFNIILEKRTSESEDYTALEVFANKFKLIAVEPNGLKRVAIYIN